MNYEKLKEKCSNGINDFEHIFFAFSNEQFKKGKAKIGITEDAELLSIGAGGFIRKSKREEFENIFKNSEKTMETALKDDDFFFDAIKYELANHEYCITGVIGEALEALGLKFEELSEKKKELLRDACCLCSSSE